MHFYEGLTLRQMADQLGISKEGAKKRVNRALAHLRRSLEGKVHRTNHRPNIAGLAVILWLLQTRRSEAAPTGLAETVAKSATIQGVSSSMAELMAHGVTHSIARARHKLLATLLLLILELVLIVPIAILRGRGQHDAGQIGSAPTATTPARVQTAVAANTPSQFQSATAAARDFGTWLDPNAPLPLPRPYAPGDDNDPSPQKVAADQPNQPTKEATPIALAQPPAQGGPLSESSQPIASTLKFTLPSGIGSASAQSNIITAAPSAVQFSQIKSALTRKTHSFVNPIVIEQPENCPQPGSRPPIDEFKFPPPPPADRPPFDPFDRPPHSQAAFAVNSGDLPDLLDSPHHEHGFRMERFESFALLDSSPRDFASKVNLSMPPEFAPNHHFPSMPAQLAYAAMSDSVAFDDARFLPPAHTLFDFDAGFSEPHFLFMSPVPEPGSLLLLLISTTTLSLRPKRKRSDAN